MHPRSLFAASVCFALSAPGFAQVSTFDADAEGWGIFSDGRNFAWDGTIGNPPGAIRIDDVVAGNIWFFSAPAAFLGDHASSYGRTLSWDILGIRGDQTSATAGADVILVGGGISIGVDAGVQPVLGQWTSWSVTLDVSGGWRLVINAGEASLSSTPATEADIRAVLSNLTGLYIRGEYTNGTDTAALDNVRLETACTADFNADGATNVQDLIAFLGAFGAQEPGADIDGDGSIGVTDLIAFLTAFSAGC